MLKHRLMTTLFAVLVGLAWVGCDDSKSSDEKVSHDHAHQGQEHHAHEGEGHHHGQQGDESAEETASVTTSTSRSPGPRPSRSRYGSPARHFFLDSAKPRFLP